MRTKLGTLDDRPVELREVSLRVGMEAQEKASRFDGAMHVLIASAHWADTGERVFKDADAILDTLNMRQISDINALSRLAQAVNAPEPDVVPTTNGTGEAHPSP